MFFLAYLYFVETGNNLENGDFASATTAHQYRIGVDEMHLVVQQHNHP